MPTRIAPRHALATLLATMLVVVGLQFAAATPASACLTDGTRGGEWRNLDRDTRALTRVVIRECVGWRSCDGDVCRSSYGTTVHPWGACQPTECDWGAEFVSSGGNGWDVSVHDFGFKTSHVWVRTSEVSGTTYLRVWTWNDFADSRRTDYSTDDWFRKR